MPGLFAAIIFSAREWLWPAVAVLCLTTVILAFSYWRGPGSPKLRATCFALKLLGFAALLACLLEPHWSDTRPKPGANYLALVADNSMGMTIRDPGADASRGEQLRDRLANAQEEWQQRLSGMFQLRRFTFDSRLQSTRDFKELHFDGRSTGLAAALNGLRERFAGQPTAGILLFTDGNATDIVGDNLDLAGLPPIYPVMVGSDESPRDISIQKISVTQTAFEDAPVTIQVEASAVGYDGKPIVAELWSRSSQTQSNSASSDNSAQLVETASVTARPGQPSNYRFTVRPLEPGVAFYEVRVFARDERAQFDPGATPAEATLANNSRTIAVNRPEGALRILYVSGRPNWEYKFLSRALADDPQVELVGLLRIARREPKFSFRGRSGEMSNPLFRGFNGDEEETERYDQPVLIRLNTRDEVELRDGFPKLAEDLFGYHAIIFDDVEASFFTHDQMTLVQKFVSERGGGFMMLGGADSFHQGNYPRTPIGEMLPVYLDRIADFKSPDAVKLELTREGWLEPWARLRRTESEERSRMDDMPLFQVLSPIRDVKPGASVLMRVRDDEGNQQPALIVQRFGRGRTGSLMVGDMWRAGLHDPQGQVDLAKAWRQIARWLVADSPNRIEVAAETAGSDVAVNLTVRARDKKFEPLDNANVMLEVQPIGSLGETNAPVASVRLSTEVSDSDPGVYSATYIPKGAGGYRVKATVAGAEGLELGSANSGWASDPLGEEFRSLTPNRSLLSMIAAKTGGRMIALNDLDDLSLDLPKIKAPVVENWTYPIWHQPFIFLVALACFLAEWGLRRWKGMA